MTNTIKKIYVLSVLLCVLLLVSCMGQSGKELMTKEYIMEHYGVTEKDIEGIDVDAVFAYYNITVKYHDFYENHDKEFLLQDINNDWQAMLKDQETAEWAEKYGRGYLLQEDRYKGEIPDVNTIKYLTIERRYERGRNSYLLDFVENILYYGPYWDVLAEDYREPFRTNSITEDDKQAIIDAIELADIGSWSNIYNGKTNYKNYAWTLGIEFEDGTVITYQGSRWIWGVPDEFDDIYEVIASVDIG